MDTSYSTTQGGNLLVVAGVISMLLKKAGVSLLPDEIAMIIAAIGVCVSWYGRWKKGDITFGGFRK